MTYRERKIKKIRDRLLLVEKAIEEVLENGVSYSLSGSHSVTSANLAELRQMENDLEMQLIRLTGGGRSRIIPTFGG